MQGSSCWTLRCASAAVTEGLPKSGKHNKVFVQRVRLGRSSNSSRGPTPHRNDQSYSRLESCLSRTHSSVYLLVRKPFPSNPSASQVKQATSRFTRDLPPSEYLLSSLKLNTSFSPLSNPYPSLQCGMNRMMHLHPVSEVFVSN